MLHVIDGGERIALDLNRLQALIECACVNLGADVKAEAHSTVGRMVRADRVPTNMLRLIGSYETVAKHMDELAAIPGLQGVMLTFDDFLIGMDQFGTRIQPLMKSRQHVKAIAA